MGFIGDDRADRAAALQRAAAEIPPGRRRAMARCSRRTTHRERVAHAISIRCRSGTRRSRTGAGSTGAAYPLHAITQRPMAMYHSWGSQNAWLRQILRRATGSTCTAPPRAALGIADDDWVWVDQPARAGEGPGAADGRRQPRHGLDLERDRQARRRLEPRRRMRRKSTQGLPAQPRDLRVAARSRAATRYANADPVTGQAAWYDLRVRIEKAEAPAATQPPPGGAAAPARATPGAAHPALRRARHPPVRCGVTRR